MMLGWNRLKSTKAETKMAADKQKTFQKEKSSLKTYRLNLGKQDIILSQLQSKASLNQLAFFTCSAMATSPPPRASHQKRRPFIHGKSSRGFFFLWKHSSSPHCLSLHPWYALSVLVLFLHSCSN